MIARRAFLLSCACAPFVYQFGLVSRLPSWQFNGGNLFVEPDENARAFANLELTSIDVTPDQATEALKVMGLYSDNRLSPERLFLSIESDFLTNNTIVTSSGWVIARTESLYCLSCLS